MLFRSIGVLFTVVSLIIALSYGLDSILWINRRLVPLLICIGPLVAAIAIWNWPGVTQVQSNLNNGKFHLLPGACTLSVLLYVSYNLLLSLSFLAALGGEVQGERAAISGGWIGGIILGFMAGMNQLAIHLYKREIAGSEVPMLLLAGNYSSLLQGLYIFALWGAIFTTALSNLYGLSRRLGDMIGCDWRLTVGPLLGIGILLSRIGFSDLIGIVYPLFGYIGLSFIIMVIVKSPMRERHLWFFFHRRD